jgi:TolB-like protein/Flp pilus assembly protein TadD
VLASVWAVLQWAAAPELPGRIASLAVLPLQDLSARAESEFFAVGMTDALITDLSGIGRLRVISRSSSMLYKDTRKPLAQIARELDVDAVVEGSVLRAGDRVRISVQLVHAASDTNVWAGSFDRALHDALDVQAEVARTIAERIRIDLTPQERARLTTPRAVDPAAYELYLRGRQAFSSTTEPGYRQALELFALAAAKDPGYALAHAGVAETWYELSSLYVAPAEAIPQARASAQRALELDPDCVDAQVVLAVIAYVYDWDWAAADALFQRALETAPGSASVRYRYGIYLRLMGRLDAALPELRSARELDPRSERNAVSYWEAMVASTGRYDEAIRAVEEVLASSPDFQYGYSLLGRLYDESGRPEQALGPYRRAVALWENPYALADLAHALARAGQRAEAESILSGLLERSERSHVYPLAMALAYTGLGEHEKAVDWLEVLYRTRDEALLYALRDKRLAGLGDHPQVREIVRKLRFPDSIQPRPEQAAPLAAKSD